MNKDKKNNLILSSIIVIIIVVSIIILYPLYDSVSALESQKNLLDDEFNSYNIEITDMNNQVANLKDNLKITRDSFNETVEELDLRTTDGLFSMYNPTYSEVMAFIKKDSTNKEKYDDETYNCGYYAMDVNNNAEEKGMRCALVVVDLRDGVAHACVAFNTSDRGILYIEPQSDEKVNLEVGEDYWADCVVEKSSRYYYPRDSDNIVLSFELYW